MCPDNWMVQNLENALETWNGKLTEIWQLITQSPETFKGGDIWNVVVSIHGALQAVGYALLVLFFVVGVKNLWLVYRSQEAGTRSETIYSICTCKGVITYGMELMLAMLSIIQGVISTIMNAAGFGTPQQTVLPTEIVTAIEDCGFFESIPLWAVTLIGSLFVWVLSFIMILSVYGRFFQNVYVHRYCTGYRCNCRRTDAECRKSSEILCGGLSWKVQLSYLPVSFSLGFCIVSACGGYRCSGGFNGYGAMSGELIFNMLVLVQYACACRLGEDGRPHRPGNDGTLIKEKNMEVKINREIRNYTESMFFGLSLRQFIFLLRLVE